MAYLKVIKGSAPGQIIELGGDRMVLGRHPNCDIVLDHGAVSRHHALILQSHEQFFLEDLRSRNKTYLNDEAVTGRNELAENDRIRVCDVVFSFHLQTPPGDAPRISPGESTITTRDRSGDSSWRRGGKEGRKATAVTHEELPELVADEPLHVEPDSSSIISSRLDAKADSSNLRLGVKPEAKLRAVVGISKALAGAVELDTVLQNTLDELFNIFPQADEGFVLLKDAEHNRFVVRATRTRGSRADDSVRISMTIVRHVMKKCEAILSQDAAQDQRFSSSESLTELRIRSMMCVPIVGADGQARGVIQVDSKDLKRQFSEPDLDILVAVAAQVSLAVENASLHEELIRRHELELEREREEREMDFAMQVQLGFIPSPESRPRPPGYEFHDYYESANRVGGDYFDYVELPDGRVAAALGDVAGKGVPAALLMARLSSSARYHLLSRATVAETLEALNGEIATGGLGHRFVSMAALVLDPNSHEVTIANAGHLPPMLRRAGGQVLELAVDVSGMPLGIVHDQKFQETTIRIEPGETILLYTDGVTEAMNPAEEIYGRKRLSKLLARMKGSAEDVVNGIVQDVEKFSQDRQQRDDMCIVCARRT